MYFYCEVCKKRSKFTNLSKTVYLEWRCHYCNQMNKWYNPKFVELGPVKIGELEPVINDLDDFQLDCLMLYIHDKKRMRKMICSCIIQDGVPCSFLNDGNCTNAFSPKFDHSKCYFWCGNPHCDSRPATKKETEAYMPK